TYQTGHKIRNSDLPYLGGTSRFANILIVNKDIAHRWTKPGDEEHTDIPRLVFPEEDLYNAQSENIYRTANINVLDARNLNIRNMSLAYRIPRSCLAKPHIPAARNQMNAENVAQSATSKKASNMRGGYRRP